jgi:hypothetical protein
LSGFSHGQDTADHSGTHQEESHVTPPPPYYGPPAAAPGNDKVTLWGVLGIVFAVCCPLLGIIFGALSLSQAKKFGKPPTLGYIAIGLGALNIIVNIILGATGAYSSFTNNN